MIKIVALPLLCWVAGAHAFGAADCGDKVRSRFDAAQPIEQHQQPTKVNLFFLVGGLLTSLLMCLLYLGNGRLHGHLL